MHFFSLWSVAFIDRCIKQDVNIMWQSGLGLKIGKINLKLGQNHSSPRGPPPPPPTPQKNKKKSILFIKLLDF